MSVKIGILDIIERYYEALDFLIVELGSYTAARNILDSNGKIDIENVSSDSPERDALLAAKEILGEIESSVYLAADSTSVEAARYARSLFELLDSAMNHYAVGAYMRLEALNNFRKAKAVAEEWASHKKKLFSKKATDADKVSPSNISSAVDGLITYGRVKKLLNSLLSRTEERIASFSFMDEAVGKLEDRARELERMKADFADAEGKLIESHINGEINASNLADMIVETRKKTDHVAQNISDCNARIDRFTKEKNLNTEILVQIRSGLENLLFCLNKTNASYIEKGIDVAAINRIIDGSVTEADIMAIVSLTETAASFNRV